MLGPVVVEELTVIEGLHAAVQLVKHAMAVQDVRYYLNGICIEVKDNLADVVATDGHRMSVVRALPAQCVAAGQYIIPADSTLLLSDDTFSIARIGHREGVVLGSGSTHLIEGKFPDWRRVIPKPTHSVKVDRDSLMAAVKASKSGKDWKVQLDILPDTVTVLFNGSTIATLPGESNDPAPSLILINGGYLLAALQVQGKGIVDIGYTPVANREVPVVGTLLIGDSEIVMPMRR